MGQASARIIFLSNEIYQCPNLSQTKTGTARSLQGLKLKKWQFWGGGVKEYRRDEVHVDLCTNRCLLDNSFRQSHPHNPFLKHRNQPEKTRKWAWWTHVHPPNQHTQTKRKQETRNQIWKWRQISIQRIEHAEGKGGRSSRESCVKHRKWMRQNPYTYFILNRRKRDQEGNLHYSPEGYTKFFP